MPKQLRAQDKQSQLRCLCARRNQRHLPKPFAMTLIAVWETASRWPFMPMQRNAEAGKGGSATRPPKALFCTLSNLWSSPCPCAKPGVSGALIKCSVFCATLEFSSNRDPLFSVGGQPPLLTVKQMSNDNAQLSQEGALLIDFGRSMSGIGGRLVRF